MGTIGGGIAGAGQGAVDGAVIGSVLGDFVSDALSSKAADNIYNAAKDFWNSLDRCKGGGTRTNGEKGKSRRYYEWDHTHGDVEVYDGRGNHLGSADGETGEMTKPPVPGRTIDR